MYYNPNPSFLAKSFQFLKSIKWGSLLDGTGKTLGVINQAIPIFYQVKPLLGNAKTLMKIASGLQEPTSSSADGDDTNLEEHKNSPIFYID